MGPLASLLCLTPLLAHIYCKDVVGIVGENFTFPVQTDKKKVEPVWRKGKDKVAEWDGENKPTYFGLLSNRSVLTENGSFTIVHLEKDDAGIYELQYRHSGKDHYLNFVLVVLDSLPEPKISCNTSSGELVLNCTAHFQGSLNYTWKLHNDPNSYPNQELSIPLENIHSIINATCIITFSQTERSSEISLIQCLPEEKGGSSNERNRSILIAVFTVCILIVVFVAFLHKKGKKKSGAERRAAQNNSPVNRSGEREQLFPGNDQQQPDSEGERAFNEDDSALKDKQIVENGVNQEATFSPAVHCEDEEPEAERAFNEDDSALKDKQIVENGVNQEEVTQDAEGGNGEHINNSSSCSKEDLKAMKLSEIHQEAL